MHVESGAGLFRVLRRLRMAAAPPAPCFGFIGQARLATRGAEAQVAERAQRAGTSTRALPCGAAGGVHRRAALPAGQQLPRTVASTPLLLRGSLEVIPNDISLMWAAQLMEGMRGTDSPWAPWLAALPARVGSPLTYSDVQLHQLAGTSLHSAVRRAPARSCRRLSSSA